MGEMGKMGKAAWTKRGLQILTFLIAHRSNASPFGIPG
jgi:hypothetical protein